MTEIERIVDQLRRAWSGEAWHGPAISEILSDVDAAKAAARPIPEAHSIWELVLHMTSDRIVAERLTQWHGRDTTPAENFPPVNDVNEKAWKAAREGLHETHRKLEAVISAWPESRLDDKVPDKPYSVYVMLHGVVQHQLYHAGQIAILKKAAIR